MKREDAILVERCLKGDEKAFEELLTKYRNPVYSICFRMVKNHSDAEDLAQDVFIRTFNVLDRYNPSYPFSSWLYRITSNLCIDFIRRRKSGVYSLDEPVSGSDGEMSRQLPAETVNPDRELENREMMEVLNQAIAELPDHYRIIVILRHQEQLSYEEISDNLGIPLGTVKARIHRARNLIKSVFIKKGLVDDAGSTEGGLS
ncbi:MAG: sigma-70 family RNA polymerase sigma factor [Candidatus Krumholzibacteriota bacterium]|nr:sigma-70 family RNA polymerase sigma factor [Candidatus Krumholzibacteriota bacterium]